MDNKLIQRKILKLLYNLRLDNDEKKALSNFIIEKLNITVKEFEFNIGYLIENRSIRYKRFFDGSITLKYYVITAEGIDFIDENQNINNLSSTKPGFDGSKMQLDGYICKNCDSKIHPKIAIQKRFNLCPSCGTLYPQTVKYIENYFRIIQLSTDLERAKRLFLKNEIDAAVRESIIQYETKIRDKSGLSELLGSTLMANAFKFKTDRDNNIVEEPKIQLNDLSNMSMRNEQEGIQFLSMGLMKGIRNIYMHTKASDKLYHGLQIITMVDFLLKCVEGYNLIR